MSRTDVVPGVYGTPFVFCIWRKQKLAGQQQHHEQWGEKLINPTPWVIIPYPHCPPQHLAALAHPGALSDVYRN